MSKRMPMMMMVLVWRVSVTLAMVTALAWRVSVALAMVTVTVARIPTLSVRMKVVSDKVYLCWT